MKRNPLVALILGAIASMAAAREAFNKKVGAGGFVRGRYHYGRFRHGETARGYPGAKLARKAMECRLGMPTGNTFVGATITWPRRTARG